jgi:hypothetical protein
VSIPEAAESFTYPEASYALTDVVLTATNYYGSDSIMADCYGRTGIGANRMTASFLIPQSQDSNISTADSCISIETPFSANSNGDDESIDSAEGASERQVSALAKTFDTNSTGLSSENISGILAQMIVRDSCIDENQTIVLGISQDIPTNMLASKLAGMLSSNFLQATKLQPSGIIIPTATLWTVSPGDVGIWSKKLFGIPILYIVEGAGALGVIVFAIILCSCCCKKCKKKEVKDETYMRIELEGDAYDFSNVEWVRDYDGDSTSLQTYFCGA